MTGDKLRVLMIAPTPYFADRGCHVRIYEEARAMEHAGHDVRIATYHLGRDMPGIPTYRIPRVRWYKKLAAGPSWHKPYLDILLFFKALSVAGKFRPHILHAHLHEGAFLGVFLKKILKVPLVFDCQGSLTTEIIDHGFVKTGSIMCGFFRFIEKHINRSADFIITSSGAGAAELVEKWDVEAHKVRSLMDGVDCDEFRPWPKDEARRALGIPPGKLVAVYIGVLNRYQGIDLLIEAIGLIRKKALPLHFLIMGFPEVKYRRMAVDAGIGDSVTFTGRIDYTKAACYISAGDIALSPKISLSEANGKLFNYMACSLPTVAFETPVNREILGDAAVYARFGSAEAFAAAVEAVAKDESRCLALGKMAREKAENEHSWRTRAKELEGIYRMILDNR
ncbi:MAG TPA: glycosyltransferase [Geobacteraceae bacterium]|nr:glycosyltransferase [Geobacteraceae bacterium]